MPPRPPCLSASAAVLFVAAAAAAEPVSFSRELRRGVDPALVSHVRGEVGALYGGIEADLLPAQGYHTRYQFTLGIRPSFWQTEANLGVVYQLAGIGDREPSGAIFRLDLARELGSRGRVETLFGLDPGASVLSVENALTLELGEDFHLSRRYRQDFALDGALEGTPIYELGATRDLGAVSSLHLGYRSAADDASLGLTFETRF